MARFHRSNSPDEEVKRWAIGFQSNSQGATMDRLRRLSYAILLLSLLCFSGIQSLFAQTATGSILGTVKDPSGAVVPGATVIVKSVSTANTRELTTTDAGTYSAIALVPGAY